MKKRLFYGVLVTLICFSTGCSTNRALEIKDLEKNKSTETKDTININQPLSNESKAQLNEFFTVFSKANIPAFEKDKLDNNSLVIFGIRCNFIYNHKALEKYEKEKSMAKLPEKYVADAVEKYLGIKLKDHSVTHEDFFYENGYYVLPYNLGVGNIFSQVDKLIDEGNNIYTAYVTLYAAPKDFSGDPNGTMGEWKKLGEIPKLYMKIKAKLKKVDGNYILIEYLKA